MGDSIIYRFCRLAITGRGAGPSVVCAAAVMVFWKGHIQTQFHRIQPDMWLHIGHRIVRILVSLRVVICRKPVIFDEIERCVCEARLFFLGQSVYWNKQLWHVRHAPSLALMRSNWTLLNRDTNLVGEKVNELSGCRFTWRITVTAVIGVLAMIRKVLRIDLNT